jgi:hypothetical protein
MSLLLLVLVLWFGLRDTIEANVNGYAIGVLY